MLVYGLIPPSSAARAAVLSGLRAYYCAHRLDIGALGEYALVLPAPPLPVPNERVRTVRVLSQSRPRPCMTTDLCPSRDRRVGTLLKPRPIYLRQSDLVGDDAVMVLARGCRASSLVMSLREHRGSGKYSLPITIRARSR